MVMAFIRKALIRLKIVIDNQKNPNNYVDSRQYVELHRSQKKKLDKKQT